MGYNNLVEVEAGNIEGLNPCRLCHNHCYEAEGVEDGFSNKGFLIRIQSCCIESDELETDDYRTEFGNEEEAKSQWNKMNPVNDSNYAELIKVINNGN